MRAALLISLLTLGIFWTRHATSSILPGEPLQPAHSEPESESWSDWWQNGSEPVQEPEIAPSEWKDETLDYEKVSEPINMTPTPDSSTNIAAFLAMIRQAEGTASSNGYNMLYGGDLFHSFADHPRIIISKWGYKSSAAGAYQILEKTWDALVSIYHFPDFSPGMQDSAAIVLIQGRGALQDVLNGNFESAVMKVNREWASLPGSPYGQKTRSMEFVKSAYLSNGGNLSGAILA